MKTNGFVELKEIEEGSEIGGVIETLNRNISDLNDILQSLTLSYNFSAYITTTTIAAGATIKVPHKLRVIPSHRIILKQVGGGVITDLNYTENYIELNNGGGSSAEVTVAIFRE